MTAMLIHASIAPALAFTLSILVLIGALSVVELARPFRATWRTRADGETWTDLVYLAVASLPDRLTRVGVEAGMLVAFGLSTSSSSSPLAPASLAAGAAAFLISDLGKYLIHRASHERAWLWPFHLAHHQPARLSVLNALRLHPVNMAYNAAIDIVPMILLSVPPQLAAVLATLRATVGVVQHANLDLEGGRQWLVNSPSLHRIHHATAADERDHNFGSTLLVWDRGFGTLRRGPAPKDVGVQVDDHLLPSSFLGQLLYPVCRERLDTTCVLSRFRALVR